MNKELITEQEQNVLYMLATGNTKKTTAQKLNIPYSRCKIIVGSLCKKFEAENLVCCVVKAIHEKLI